MKLKIFTFLMASVVSGLANAAWELKQSQLDFITTKVTTANQSVSEIGRFKDVTGTVEDDGKITFRINPLSVDTGIEIRDGRLKEWVFATQDYAAIEVTGQVDSKIIEDVRASTAGSLKTLETELTLTIRDKTQIIKTTVNIVRDTQNGLYITLAQPLFINVADFGLDEGVAKLTEVAKLGLIINQIPVTFSGHFVEKPALSQ